MQSLNDWFYLGLQVDSRRYVWDLLTKLHTKLDAGLIDADVVAKMLIYFGPCLQVRRNSQKTVLFDSFFDGLFYYLGGRLLIGLLSWKTLKCSELLIALGLEDSAEVAGIAGLYLVRWTLTSKICNSNPRNNKPSHLNFNCYEPVSYTHLTLPTIYSV